MKKTKKTKITAEPLDEFGNAKIVGPNGVLFITNLFQRAMNKLEQFPKKKNKSHKVE